MPAIRRRIARRASGGVPKKPLKKLRWLLVGWARVSVQDLTLPSRETRKGSWAWPLLTWKPVTLPTAWQGSDGQDGSGVVAVCAQHDRRLRGGRGAGARAELGDGEDEASGGEDRDRRPAADLRAHARLSSMRRPRHARCSSRPLVKVRGAQVSRRNGCNTGVVLRSRVLRGHGVADPARAFEAERFAGAVGQVPGEALRVGAAVDHAGDDLAAVEDELDRGPAGKAAVGDAERPRAQRLAAGGPLAVEAGPVPGGPADSKRREGDAAAGLGFVGGARRGAAGAGGGRSRPASAASAQTPSTAAQRAPKPARLFFPAFILFATLTGLADGLALKELRYAADACDSPQRIGSPDLRAY